MTSCLTQYYRCPSHSPRVALRDALSENSGYFRIGEEIVYGKCSQQAPASSPQQTLHDALQDTVIEGGISYLSFDPAQVADNLRFELYPESSSDSRSMVDSTIVNFYYLLRPWLPVSARKYLQRIRLSGWRSIPFPHWPVDRTVDKVFEKLFLLSLRAQEGRRIPFIWFWPNGAPSCAIMTHDVETVQGRDYCSSLMDIDESFGIQASFQVVPEQRYEVTSAYLDSIRNRGFEVAVQDLNHDGQLYRNREEFLRRAARINSYGREWGAEGFRAAVLYRRQEWFDSLDFAYDMSVPNVAHLDPQRGGCCTVMPYFIGKVLELPVTATQDYTLFHILKDHSIDLWKKQSELIMEKHGLLSFIVHPDYITTRTERETYEALLGYLRQLREENNVWIATPREVNRWWRQRAQMNLVESSDGWRIDGDGKERAQIAYASEEDGNLKVTFEASSLVS